MPDIELFVKETLHPLYNVYYATWVYWWPLWRGMYSRRNILQKWQRNDLVKKGQTFLDYGCGTGSFTVPAARIVGAKGKVYALDCFPRQLGIVGEKLKKEGLDNVETILSDREVSLPDECIDVVWMCDVFHEIRERRVVLEELHRVLKKEGILVIYDGMKDRMLSYTEGLFSLTLGEGKLFKFAKTE